MNLVLSSKTITGMSSFLAGIVLAGAVVLGVVWALDLMDLSARVLMLATLVSDALLAWVLWRWAARTERAERAAAAQPERLAGRA